jgi:hypothetical protein
MRIIKVETENCIKIIEITINFLYNLKNITEIG